MDICKRQAEKSLFYYFKKSFVASVGDTLTADICADTRYQLYLNGNLVCEGPCQGAESVNYYESADLTPFIKDGENLLFVKVLYVTDGYFTTLFPGLYPALWFDGRLTHNGETTSLCADDSWECLRDDSVLFSQAIGLHPSMPPFEEWLGEKSLTPIVLQKKYEPTLKNRCINPYGVFEPKSMTRRIIPHLTEQVRRSMTEVRRGEGYVIYDTGEYTTAKVYIDLKAPKNSIVKVTYAECCSFAPPRYAIAQDKRIRDDVLNPDSRIDGGCDIIHASGEKETFSPFWFRAFRYIKIEYPQDTDCNISAPVYAPYFYPLDDAGSFECSDDRYNKMWHISRNTLLCCTHEMYVDCPYYEQGQYIMDAGLEMLYTFRASSDKLMPRKSILDLAASQIDDGMLCANYPAKRTQVIPNFTLYWVLMAREYIRYSGDISSIKPLLGVIDKALEAFENLKNDDGLIGPTPYWAYIDWVPGWPYGTPIGAQTSPLTVTCLMYATALRAASEICDKVGKSARAEEYRVRAEEMIEKVNARCYDSEIGLYRDLPDTESFSQHTTVWAILSGAVTGDEAGALIDRTFNSEVKVAKCSFSINHYLFRALEASGRYCYAPKLFEGWQRMLDLHCTTWCENPDSPRSECHAWSSAPTYEFSEMTLGVYPIGDGYSSIRIRPHISDLGITWAKGTVPTPIGVIEIDWKKENGIFELNVTLPNGAEANVELPNGKIFSNIKGKAAFKCEIYLQRQF